MVVIASSIPSLNITYTLTDGTVTETSSVGLSMEFPNGTGTGQVNIGVAVTGYISSGETIIYDFQKFPKEIWNSQIFLDFTSESDAFPLIANLDNPERGIKGLIVTNTWNTSILPTGAASISSWSGIVTPTSTGLDNEDLPRINIRATGVYSAISGGFTQLFNSKFNIDESGNIPINPQSTWSYVDPVGKTPIFDASSAVYMTTLSIVTENFTNISGSGGLSSGTSGDAVYYPIWNDVTSGSPWSGNLPRLSYEILAIGVTG